jgi:hypothetical protein
METRRTAAAAGSTGRRVAAAAQGVWAWVRLHPGLKPRQMRKFSLPFARAGACGTAGDGGKAFVAG